MARETNTPGDKKNNISEDALRYKKENTHWKHVLHKYMPIAAVIIIIAAISLIIFFMIYRYEGLASGFQAVKSALQAIIIGFVIAYLINPIMKYFERKMLSRIERRGGSLTYKHRQKVRGRAVAIALLIVLAIITTLIVLIVPRIIQAAFDLVENFSVQTDYIDKALKTLAKTNAGLAKQIEDALNSFSDNFLNWLQEKLNTKGNLVDSVTSSLYSIVRTMFNFLIGIIVAVYILMKKEVFKGQVKKLVYAIFRPRFGNYVMDVLRKTDDVFGGFFIGDIIDSVIIGFITLAVVLILKIPYAPLIALIVGVTNLIPVFGPYFGAVPSAILIVLVDPWKALYFLIAILVIQQFDGNILKPKVLGDNVGLSPFWIIFAVVLFGSLFGVAGYFLGVPIFAVIYYIVKRIAEHVLRRKNLPSDTPDYIRMDHVDPRSNEAVMHAEEDIYSYMIDPNYCSEKTNSIYRKNRRSSVHESLECDRQEK